MPPLPGSPAIDPTGGAATSPFPTDQRGLPRVLDGNAVAGAIVDIGAVEYDRTMVLTLADTGPGSLRDTFTAAPAASTLTFAPHLSGGTIPLTLTHCTFSGNTNVGSNTGCIYNEPARTITMAHSILYGNIGGTDVFNNATLNVTGTSIIGVLAGSGTTTGTRLTTAPLLAPLGNYGGPTQTMALMPTSPARDAATGSAITTDQRGFPIAGLPDIGAFEFPNIVPIAPNITTTATTGDQKTITLTATDADNDTLTVTSTTPDSHLTVNSTNGLDVTFTPATNFAGDATLGYTVSDGNGGTASGTITITIADNDAPEISGTFSPRMVFAGTMPDFRSQATASDNIGVPTITQTPQQGSATTAGTVLVTLTATDTAGNTATTTFFLSVRPLAPVHTSRFAIGDAAPGAGTNGLPADAKLTSFGPPAIGGAGNTFGSSETVAFIGKWKSATSRGTGLFVNNTCLAIVGGPAPIAGAKYVRFTDPVVDGGKVACIATLTGTTKSVVLSNVNTTGALAILARVGGAATADGAKFKAFKAVAIHAGNVGIFAQLSSGSGTTPKTTAASDLGLWVFENGSLIPALREGQLVGGKTIKTLVSFAPGAGSPGQGRGWLSDNGDPEVHALAFFTDKTQGVVLKNTDESNPIILSLSGTTADGAPDITGATFATYSLPARNDASATTFAATMRVDATSGVTKANARGIFLNPASTGKFTPLARLGAPAGVNSANFSKLSDPVLSPDSSVAFLATLKGGTAKGLLAKTLWWKPVGQPL